MSIHEEARSLGWRSPDPVVYESYAWWSQIRLEFVLNNLDPPWLVAPVDSPCPQLLGCEDHYDRTQLFVWRIGEVLLNYVLLPLEQRERDFQDFEPLYQGFYEAWRESADQPAERRLPQHAMKAWWHSFGNNAIKP